MIASTKSASTGHENLQDTVSRLQRDCLEQYVSNAEKQEVPFGVIVRNQSSAMIVEVKTSSAMSNAFVQGFSFKDSTARQRRKNLPLSEKDLVLDADEPLLGGVAHAMELQRIPRELPAENPSFWYSIIRDTDAENETTDQWTEEKNERRCALVDKEIDETLSVEESEELEQLQSEMLAYRREVAPLPIKEIRDLHQQLLRKAAEHRD